MAEQPWTAEAPLAAPTPTPELDGLEVVRAEGALDGAATLGDAADRLVRLAAELRQRETEGWQLTGPVEDDYGYMRQGQPAPAPPPSPGTLPPPSAVLADPPPTATAEPTATV